MTVADLEITGDPGQIWHVGHAPNPWQWTSWEYATDSGLFNGRWDDQLGQFRTIYTAESLLGCFLELLAPLRPSKSVITELEDFEDDDGSVSVFSDTDVGAVGYQWLENRVYGFAQQIGRYCFITHSRTIATLAQSYPIERHGLTPANIDTALLKDARDRVLTRSVARWLYDLVDPQSYPLVDGVHFLSRHGDDVGVWAIFERSEDGQTSRHLRTSEVPNHVSADTPELRDAFKRFKLYWV